MNDFYNLKLSVNKAQSNKRLDKTLTNLIQKISRSQVKILIQNGNVKKNNKIINDSSYIVKEGDSFEVSIFQNKPNDKWRNPTSNNTLSTISSLFVV